MCREQSGPKAVYTRRRIGTLPERYIASSTLPQIHPVHPHPAAPASPLPASCFPSPSVFASKNINTCMYLYTCVYTDTHRSIVVSPRAPLHCQVNWRQSISPRVLPSAPLSRSTATFSLRPAPYDYYYYFYYFYEYLFSYHCNSHLSLLLPFAVFPFFSFSLFFLVWHSLLFPSRYLYAGEEN